MSTVIRARLPEGHSIDVDSFADITTSAATVAWDDEGRLEVTFADDLTGEERHAVRIRILADTPAEEALMAELVALIGQNPDTAAARLTRLELAFITLIRILLKDDDG